MVGWAPRWSQQLDHYDWLSAYLHDRGLQTQWRAATFTFTAVLGALPIVTLGTPVGPDRPLTVALAVGAAGCGAAGAVLWLTRWPTRRQSILFSLMASGAIAATCLAQSDPYPGLAGCTAFAVIGGFIAYFHTVGYLVVNFAVAAVCSAFLAVRVIVTTGDVALASAALLTVAALNIGVPFGIESMVKTLRSDVRSSGHDPLTGLLNRRSFYPSAYELLVRHRRDTDAYLVVAVIDLDNFKHLNDTRGHAAGDEALVGVAAALRESCRPTAVIGRSGGEEFVTADTDREANPAAMAERLRRAIIAIPFEVTASIGTASAPLNTDSPDANLELIEGLIRSSDSAMYEAKRAGGNRIRHSQDVAPSDTG
jgi:diguanylate cyclase (GGDEF)-like protein